MTQGNIDIEVHCPDILWLNYNYPSEQMIATDTTLLSTADFHHAKFAMRYRYMNAHNVSAFYDSRKQTIIARAECT